MPPISRSRSHLYLKGSTYYFRQVVPPDLRHALGRTEIRVSLRTGYLTQARPLARRLTAYTGTLMHQIRNGELAVDTLREIKLYMNDFLRRYLAENEIITIHALDKTDPKIAPQTQYMPGNTEAIIAHLKTLLRTRDMDAMRQYAQIAAEDGAFGPPDGFIMTDEFAFEFTKTILSYYQIITHRAEGDYAFERTILPPETTPSPVPQTEAPCPPPLVLSEAIAAFAKDRRDSKYWTERSAHDILSTLEYLPDILGDIPLPQVDRSAMKEVKSTLLQLPPNRKKAKAYRDKSIAEVLAMRPEKTLSANTINNILTNISSFLTWCVGEGLLDANPAQHLKIKDDTPETDFKAPFTRNDLEALFNAPKYRDDGFARPEDFWLPLLALYTGARREELAQLHVQDVRQVDGLWVLDINKEPDSKGELQKKVKNASAVRLIPLHPVLAETLRFPDYVESVRRQGHERVFPLLKKVRTNFGHSFGSRFAKFKQTLSLEPSKGNKDFHSLRHTFSNYFKQNRLQGDEFSQVFGHKNPRLAAERYGDRFPVGTIYARVIAKLDYGIDLSHLATSKFIPPVDAD